MWEKTSQKKPKKKFHHHLWYHFLEIQTGIKYNLHLRLKAFGFWSLMIYIEGQKSRPEALHHRDSGAGVWSICFHWGFSKSIKLKIKYRAYHHSMPGRLYLCICVFVFVISSSKAREAGPVMCEGIQRSPQLRIESRKEEGGSKTNWQASTRQGAKNQTQTQN